MTKAKVKYEEWYTMQDIIKLKMFPWVHSLWSVRNVVKLDRENNNILKATIKGRGRATKYHFKGENIINFVNQVEAGKVRL